MLVNNNTSQNLYIITSIVYKYNTKNIIEQIKKILDSKKDNFFKICINDCPSKIKKKKIDNKPIRKLKTNVDETTDFY